MPRIPSESSIAISSASPTPDRPAQPRNPSRRSSSLLPITTATATAGPSTRPARPIPLRSRPSHDFEDPSALPGPSRPAQNTFRAPERRHPFTLAPRPQGLAIPTRPGRPGSGSVTPVPGRIPIDRNARDGGGGGQSRTEAIDLTEDDDDDVQLVGMNEAPAPRRAARTGPLWRDLHHIDHVTAEREQAFRNLLREDDIQARRAIPSENPAQRAPPGGIRFAPTPEEMLRQHHPLPARPNNRLPGGDVPIGVDDAPAPRPRIGLGGAVIRRGAQQINYRNELPPRPRPPPGALVDPEDDERADLDGEINARVQRRTGNRTMDAPLTPPPGGRRPQRPVGPARVRAGGPVQSNANINERIEQAVRERDNGGFPGALDGLGPDQFLDFLGQAGGAGWIERFRVMRQGMAGRMPYPGGDDPQAIIAQVPTFEYPPAPEGFTSDFEIDSTIEIDQPASSKRFLACVYCVEPLLLQSGEKTPGDKNWALRCGHIIHQRCLEKISSPQSEDDRDNVNRPDGLAGLPVLGGGDIGVGKRGRTAKRPRAAKKQPSKPVEYEWTCPVKHCGHPHRTVLKDAEWKQDEMEGALQMYT